MGKVPERGRGSAVAGEGGGGSAVAVTVAWPTMVRRDERWQIFASVRKKTESFCPAAGEQREARSEEEEEEEEQGEARLKTV